jgi:hypothetical protein
MAERTGDIKAVAELLIHRPTSLTVLRYTLGSVAPRLTLAVKAFNAAMPKSRLEAWQCDMAVRVDRQRPHKH